MGDRGGRGGKFGRADFGTKHHLHEQDWGTKRQEGKSSYSTFSFLDKYGNTRLVTAKSFEEALAQAHAQGLTLKRED